MALIYDMSLRQHEESSSIQEFGDTDDEHDEDNKHDNDTDGDNR